MSLNHICYFVLITLILWYFSSLYRSRDNCKYFGRKRTPSPLRGINKVEEKMEEISTSTNKKVISAFLKKKSANKCNFSQCFQENYIVILFLLKKCVNFYKKPVYKKLGSRRPKN